MGKLSEEVSTLTDLEQEYITGFEDGCNFLFNEVIMWGRHHPGALVTDLVEKFKERLKEANESRH